MTELAVAVLGVLNRTVRDCRGDPESRRGPGCTGKQMRCHDDDEAAALEDVLDSQENGCRGEQAGRRDPGCPRPWYQRLPR